MSNIFQNRFILDGYDLYDGYHIVVKSADGLDIIPKVKTRDEHSWPDESGVEVDASTDLTFEPLDISLNCFVIEDNFTDAIKRVNGLINKLSGDGLHLLGSVVRGRLYPVLLREVSSYKRITSTEAIRVALEFTIKLLCPLPECRMGSATVLAAGAVSLDAETDKEVTVWWGDGSSSTGTGILEHTYTNAGTYTILIAGTGVTTSVFTLTGGIVIDEYSYPAAGDITHVDVSHTSEEAWASLNEHVGSSDPHPNLVTSDTDAFHKSETAEINGLETKTPIHDNDVMLAEDSEAGYSKIKISKSALKASIGDSVKNELRDGVDAAGDTLKKLYDLNSNKQNIIRHPEYAFIAIGELAGFRQLDDGFHGGNIYVGDFAGANSSGGYENIFIGIQTGEGNIYGDKNVFVGDRAGRYNVGSYNALFGHECGLNNAGDYNVMLGANSGRSLSSGGGNIFLGAYAAGQTSTANNIFCVNNFQAFDDMAQSLIWAVMSPTTADQAFRINASVGVNKNPTVPLDVVGKIAASGSVKVGTDADAANSSNAGAVRYRTSSNGSYCEMVMKTGASTYAWVAIKQNSW